MSSPYAGQMLVDMKRAVVDESDNGFHLVHFGRYLWFRGKALPPPATLLDVGCGHFQLACVVYGDIVEASCFVLPETVYSLFKGVDANEQYIREVKERYDLDVIHCAVGREPIPLGTSCWNNVIAGEVFEHIPKGWWSFALQECFRVAKNQVLISIPAQDSGVRDGFDDDPLEHSYEPTLEQFRQEITDALPGVRYEVETLRHVPEKFTVRGFHYAQIVKEPWW